MKFIIAVLLMASEYTYADCANININDYEQHALCDAKQGNNSCVIINDVDLHNQCEAQTS